MSHDDPDRLAKGPPEALPLEALPLGIASRRAVLLAGAAAVLPTSFAAASTDSGAAEEGYFLVFEDKGSNPEKRIFFIPSAWLSVFEVTDAYKAVYGGNWANEVKAARNKVKNDTSVKKYKVDALYMDINEPDLNNHWPRPNVNVIAPPTPGAQETYLAMMIGPDL